MEGQNRVVIAEFESLGKRQFLKGAIFVDFQYELL